MSRRSPEQFSSCEVAFFPSREEAAYWPPPLVVQRYTLGYSRMGYLPTRPVLRHLLPRPRKRPAPT